MTISYPHSQPPAAGELVTVAKGIRWAQMPLPFALDHVNVWVLEGDLSTCLIDTSIDSLLIRQHWQTVLDQCQQPPDRLLLTHYHPDHAGLAQWFQSEHKCTVLTSKTEFDQLNRAWNASDEEFSAGQSEWYRVNGLDQQRLQALAGRGNSYKSLVSGVPSDPHFLKDGDTFEANVPWSVITAGGHSPEMICLFNAELNVLIAGDQVLPRITPNISLTWYLEDDNPMHSFLSSFDLFSHLPEDVLVLPSHGLPFHGLHERLEIMRVHHEERFERILAFCQQPRSATQLLPELFSRELDLQQLVFGMGESLAHLRYLERSGRLQRTVENAVERYQTVGAA